MTFMTSITKQAARLTKSVALAASISAVSMTAAYAQDVTLRGASMFDEEHAFTQTLREFERLVAENYDGEVTFDLILRGCRLITKNGRRRNREDDQAQRQLASPFHISPFPVSQFAEATLSRVYHDRTSPGFLPATVRY